MPSSQTKKNIPYKYLSLKIYLKCIRIDGHVLILRSWKWRWSLFFFLSPENVAHVKTRCRKNPRVLILLICSIFSFILPFISFIVTLELGIITIPISRPPFGWGAEQRRKEDSEGWDTKFKVTRLKTVPVYFLYKPCL